MPVDTNTPFHAPKRSRFAERAFAWVWGHAHGSLERCYGKMKSELFADLRGRVVEIGPGAGINLEHVPAGVHVTGVEPNVFMHPLLHQAAARTGVDFTAVEGYGEQLPFEDNSVDAVISTLVLCSVFAPERVVGEVLRVLRPGGKFYFIEHVAAPLGTRRRRVQEWIAPLWGKVGDGCQPNRETWRVLETAGFSDVRLEHRHVRTGLYPVTPHIIGTAVK